MPAALLMIGIMVVTMFRGLILARYYPDTTPGILILLSCFAIMTVSMSEPVFMERHSFEWILVVAIVGCARALTSRLGEEQLEDRDQPGFIDEPEPQMAGRRLRPRTPVHPMASRVSR